MLSKSLPALLIVGLLALPAVAVAGGKKAGTPSGHPIVRLLADAQSASIKDITLIAVGNPLDRENGAGSAALVRLDDGRDGGVPICWLLELAGKAFGPGKIEAQLRLSVCPTGPVKGAQLARVALSAMHEAWQVRIESARYDSKAQGVESAALWGLYGKYGTTELRPLWERTSTTFKSKADPTMNQAETCGTPEISAGGQEPDAVTVHCDTETMLGKLPKRAKQNFRSAWMGDKYSMN